MAIRARALEPLLGAHDADVVPQDALTSSQLCATTTPSSGASASPEFQSGMFGGGPLPSEKSPTARSAARRPKTSPSSSEFEASRFAPCRPVQATSPIA